jgi:hypothetical protein
MDSLRKTITSTNIQPKATAYPYYKPHFAEQILQTIDEVVRSRAPILWPTSGISLTTLYLKWQQAAAYIKDNHPQEDVTKLGLVEITRLKNIGLRIKPRSSAILTMTSDAVDWKNDFLMFLEQGNSGEHFEKVGIPISTEDKAWIMDKLQPMLEEYVTDIRPDKLLIVKL